MMRPRAEQRGNTLEVRYTGPLPETIHTDGDRLRQVIVNLVGNAVKFTENGSIRIGVSFLPQWRAGQSAVSVEVTDTGIGIRQEALPRLFEPFTQAESSTTRKYGGTGLGLAISRQIVTALGGELTVRSTPGEGSTFTVTIPTGDISGVNLLQSPGEVICEDEAGTRWTPGAGALRRRENTAGRGQHRQPGTPAHRAGQRRRRGGGRGERQAGRRAGRGGRL